MVAYAQELIEDEAAGNFAVEVSRMIVLGVDPSFIESAWVLFDGQRIIEVFAQRAQTREARLQVELAKVKYQLPRLKRLWTHLSRQAGSGGGSGGGGASTIGTRQGCG